MIDVFKHLRHESFCRSGLTLFDWMSARGVRRDGLLGICQGDYVFFFFSLFLSSYSPSLLLCLPLILLIDIFEPPLSPCDGCHTFAESRQERSFNDGGSPAVIMALMFEMPIVLPIWW